VIASGDNVAFGAPRFPFSGVAVAVDEREGVGVGGGGGVSLGSGFGEDFFFAFDDGDALGDGEMDFFWVTKSAKAREILFLRSQIFSVCVE